MSRIFSEAYSGPEGLIEYNTIIVAARTKLFEDYADGHYMTFHTPATAMRFCARKSSTLSWKSVIWKLDLATSEMRWNLNAVYGSNSA